MYKKFKAASDEELVKQGYTEEKIKKMKSLDYKEEMKKKVDKLEKVDVQSLKNMGYTNEQIKDLKNYSGTEEQVYALSASVTLRTYKMGASKSASYSQITYKTTWEWSSVPVWLEEDILAVPWSEGMYIDLNSSSTYGKYEYYDEWTNTYENTYSVSVTPNLNNGASVKFDMGYHNSDIGGSYAKKGTFGYKLSKNALVTQICIQPTYGHTILQVGSPTVSFPAGVSVSFSWGTETEAQSYYQNDFN